MRDLDYACAGARPDGVNAVRPMPILQRSFALQTHTTSGVASFRLSRVYAQGWNAARQLSANTRADAAASLNPYTSEPERTRWLQGFANASE